MNPTIAVTSLINPVAFRATVGVTLITKLEAKLTEINRSKACIVIEVEIKMEWHVWYQELMMRWEKKREFLYLFTKSTTGDEPYLNSDQRFQCSQLSNISLSF